MAKVQILSEITLGEPMYPVRLRSRDRLRNIGQAEPLAIDKMERESVSDENGSVKRRLSQIMSKIRSRKSSNVSESDSESSPDASYPGYDFPSEFVIDF